MKVNDLRIKLKEQSALGRGEFDILFKNNLEYSTIDILRLEGKLLILQRDDSEEIPDLYRDLPTKTPILPDNPLAIQEGGHHYKDSRIQPIEFFHANPGLTYSQCAIIKHAFRLGNKGGVEGTKLDIKKIKHYCDLYLQLEEPSKEVEERKDKMREMEEMVADAVLNPKPC